MLHFFKRAIRDILANSFLSAVAIVTIALSVLIISAFALFFINAEAIMDFWTAGIRVMAYLNPDISEKDISDTQQDILGMNGVTDARFIPKKEALEQFRSQMKGQPSLIDNLRENPLPDAFEICMADASRNWEDFERLAKEIGSLSSVEDVEYGQTWLGRFIRIFNLFRLTGYALGCLFFMATVFFVANTIRLVLYSRQEEIEIMRLVGASESFIKDPFYIQSLIQGALGGFIGLGTLFVIFNFIIGNWELGIGNRGLSSASDFQFPITGFDPRFLPPDISIGIFLGSMFVGWLGCYLSLKQFLKLET